MEKCPNRIIFLLSNRGFHQHCYKASEIKNQEVTPVSLWKEIIDCIFHNEKWTWYIFEPKCFILKNKSKPYRLCIAYDSENKILDDEEIHMRLMKAMIFTMHKDVYGILIFVMTSCNTNSNLRTLVHP